MVCLRVGDKSFAFWGFYARVVTMINSYVVAYGSLMSRRSLAVTIGKLEDKARIITIPDLRRSWIAGNRNNPNLAKFWVKEHDGEELVPIFKPCYLNVVACIGDALIAPLIPVTEEQLIKIDEREGMYKRVDLSKQLKDLNIKEPIYIYIGEPDSTIRVADSEAMIPQPYLELCIKAAGEWGREVSDNFRSQVGRDELPIRSDIKLGDGTIY